MKQMYIHAVKLKSANNIHRVADRTKREVLRVALQKVLKAKGISFEDFEKTSTALVQKIRPRQSSHSVDVPAQ